ncbi:50S ribosomal protein L24 [archaeon]|nr:MAG: 50S ribosomal protein L24 [archaeon]
MVTRSPRKQRKKLYKMPQHRRHKVLQAPLNSELRGQYGAHSMPVRKGDKVRITRGDYVGHEGEITHIDRKATKINVEGATIEKTDGTERSYSIHPSNVEITQLGTTDEMRKKSIEKKGW